MVVGIVMPGMIGRGGRLLPCTIGNGVQRYTEDIHNVDM